MFIEREKSQWLQGILSGKLKYTKRGQVTDLLVGKVVKVDFGLAEGDTLLGGIVSLDDLMPLSRKHFEEQEAFIITDHRTVKGYTVVILDSRYPVSLYRLRDYLTNEPLALIQLNLQLV